MGPKKISVKIFLAIFVGTAFILVAVSLFAFLFTRAALRQSIMGSQLEIARQSMNKIDRLIYERCADIQAIAGEESLEAYLSGGPDQHTAKSMRDGSRRITELTVITGPWDLLVVTNVDGKIILSSEEEELYRSVKEDEKRTEAYEAAMRRELYYSDRPGSSHLSRFSMIFAFPVQNDNLPKRPVVGSVIGYFSWPAVLQVLEDIPQAAALVDREGSLIGQNAEFTRAHPTLTRIVNTDLLKSLKQGSSISVVDSQEKTSQDKLESLGAQTGYLSYQGNGWGLVLDQPARVAFAPATKSALKLVLFLVPVVLLAAIPILVLVLRWVSGPITALTRTTQQIAAGDLTKRVSVTSDDEMGELAVSFNAMTDKIEQFNEGLELQVKQRTAELIKANRALLQSEKMSAVGQLAAGVAHEINNPLGVILGFAQGMVRRVAPGDALEMPLKSIEREALRCKQLVQDLLTFSRTGKSEKEEIDINETIEASLSLIMAQTKIKNTELVRELEPGIPKILANRSQIQQVIINLSNNAMDAMSDSGKLTIRTAKTTLGGKRVVEIQVSDTGQGIPKEIQPKIFEPFFTTKEVGKGTGLGLSLVFEIVQKHEGRILVNSELGKGTTFKVYLPL